MKIFILMLLAVALTACAVVPLAPAPFYDGPRIGPRRGHFVPVPIPAPAPYGHGFYDRHHRR